MLQEIMVKRASKDMPFLGSYFDIIFRKSQGVSTPCVTKSIGRPHIVEVPRNPNECSIPLNLDAQVSTKGREQKIQRIICRVGV